VIEHPAGRRLLVLADAVDEAGRCSGNGGTARSQFSRPRSRQRTIVMDQTRGAKLGDQTLDFADLDLESVGDGRLPVPAGRRRIRRARGIEDDPGRFIRVVDRILASRARKAFSVGPITVGKGRAIDMALS